MSGISNVYDALTSLITTALPDHQELNNPYFPESDAELSYDKAYGVAFAEGSLLFDLPDGNPYSGTESRRRNFIVTLTRRKFATSRDRATRATTEKDLMEDWTTFVDALAECPRLGSPSISRRSLYISDGGIEFLTLDRNRKNILLIRTIVQVDYEQIVAANGD